MRRSQKCLLLALILLLAGFFRFHRLTSVPPGLYPDEAMDGNNALEVIETGKFKTFYPENNGREGLYINILVFFVRFLGTSPWVVRLPAALAGILSVLGLYCFVQELFRGSPESSGRATRFALLSAFFLATSCWHVNFSRTGLRAILSPLCLIWAMFFFFKSVNMADPAVMGERGRDSGGRSTLHAIAAGVIFGAGFYSYIAYRIAVLLLPLLHRIASERSSQRRFRAFVYAGLVTALPLGIHFLLNPSDFTHRMRQVSLLRPRHSAVELIRNIVRTMAMFNFRGDLNWRHNLSGNPELFWPVGILFVIGVVLAIRNIWHCRGNVVIQRNTVPAIVILSWLVLGGLPSLLSDEGVPHALRSILMVTPAVVLAAMGGEWIYTTLRRHLTGFAVNLAAVVFLAAVPVSCYFDYFVVWAAEPQVRTAFTANLLDVANQINAMPRSMPKYVVGNNFAVETIMFVTHSYTESSRNSAKIRYLEPSDIEEIPPATPADEIFVLSGPRGKQLTAK